MACDECCFYTVLACPCCGPDEEDDDGYREWLARQTPEVQRRQRDAREPAWDEMAADRAMARAEKRREREER